MKTSFDSVHCYNIITRCTAEFLLQTTERSYKAFRFINDQHFPQSDILYQFGSDESEPFDFNE